MELKDFTKVSPYRWVAEKDKHKSSKTKMNVDAEIFATEAILKNAVEDQAIQQVINVSSLPGILSHSYAMPDIHYGYGFCIGGVAAFPADSGIVLPGGVGYDINCGVRLLSTNIPHHELEDLRESIGYAMLSKIPTGLTKKSNLKLSQKQFTKVLKAGAEEIARHYTKTQVSSTANLKFIESSGKLAFDMPEIISPRAIERGHTQVGSLGGGNHFIEIQLIDEIYDENAAAVFGLEKGNISIRIHTGSRGFGHQVASDYIEKLRKKNLHKINVPDPQLIYAEIQSKEGQQYLQALNAASNFAWANRHLLMDDIVKIFEEMFKRSAQQLGIGLVYDQAHNIAKFEDHVIAGENQRVLIHRKGATRAFPPGHKDIPAEYQSVGQPVLIPGSMGTASYVLRGTAEAMELSLGSSAHGAGRRLSRHKAIKFSSGMNVREKLKKQNILVFSYSNKGLREEIPEAYKEIDEVIDVTHGAGISKKVARMIPLVVVKG
ncbi:MAG: RtcB family protein [Candidatus Aminicenantes bacterium]|nr:MAG: RtcB family protein [Candidatus Aminicenantes bacterium]